MHLFTSKFLHRPSYVTEIKGSITTPAGFLAAGVSSGIKKSGKLDLGLLISKVPCTSAALYTASAAAAAPVKVCREDLNAGAIQGVVVNSGIANACTGKQGLTDARLMRRMAAALSGIPVENMAVASTGVIGVPLEMDVVKRGIAAAAKSLSEMAGEKFAKAIKTTDRLRKEGAVEIKLHEGMVKIGACAKGAGMIAPNMATMLAFVTTDARLPATLLEQMLADAVANSFNSISVDGDMSTNDCIFLLANGKSGVMVKPGTEDAQMFTEALAVVCKSLALKMVADGEGATKVIELKLRGATSEEEAQRVARAISNSPLVRTAFYGRDANWGRIMASAGAALAGEQELMADIFYEDICLAQRGAACTTAIDEEKLRNIMLQPEISVTVDLHRGGAEYKMYFSDLTRDYVTLNAAYTT
jgi:glutamate N-acetyltransferase/amino-acid N-acetyltransferase